MLHRKASTSLALSWTLVCLGVAWWSLSPLSARGGEARAKTLLPTLRISVPVARAIQMSEYFPNPHPRVQAVGNPQQAVDRPSSDHAARLLHATALSPDGIGYEVMAPGMRRNYGTYELVELIRQTGAAFAERHSDSVVQVGDLSRRRGGTIRDRNGRRVHSSHRNGLDADINYLREPCGEATHLNDLQCPADVRENLELMRLFVQGGPPERDSLVRRFYVGERFRARACRLLDHNPGAALRYRDVFERMEVIGGHQAHFHVRLKCPKLSRNCPRSKVRKQDPCGSHRI